MAAKRWGIIVSRPGQRNLKGSLCWTGGYYKAGGGRGYKGCQVAADYQSARAEASRMSNEGYWVYRACEIPDEVCGDAEQPRAPVELLTPAELELHIAWLEEKEYSD